MLKNSLKLVQNDMVSKTGSPQDGCRLDCSPAAVEMSASCAGSRICSLADVQAIEQRPYEQELPAPTTWGLIERAASQFPTRPAFVWLRDGAIDAPTKIIDYQTLAANIQRAANLFRSLGAGPDDAVAILAPNMPETQYALWGAEIAARACPINFMLQPEHIATLLKASRAKIIVALGACDELDIHQSVQRVLELFPLPVLWIDANASIGPATEIAATITTAATRQRAALPSFQQQMEQLSPRLQFDPQLLPDRVSAYFHTGGTTGAPKLAQHTHCNEAHTSWFAHRYYDFDEHTVEINGFPLFHVAGAFVYGLSVLAVGGAQVLPTLVGLRSASFMRHYWQWCERERVTALACVPTILASLANLAVDADISSIRVAYTGGSPLPVELAAQFERNTGLPVRNILGMTESGGLVTIEPAGAPRTIGSAGIRLPYSEIKVVPWRDGQAHLHEVCAPDATGVIALRGPHVSPGYTDSARNPGMFEQGWLISGDLGHLDALGNLHVTGRAKDVIIRGSHNIDPGLVEEAFLAHPAVALCAVVAEPDAHAGELPVAFVTLKAGMSGDADQLLREIGPTVYERPATPKRLTVIDVMPMTAVGKIYKPALRLRAIETKLTELLAPHCEGQDLRVQAEDRDGRLIAKISLMPAANTTKSTAGRAKLEQRLRAAMAAITVPLEFGPG